MKFRTLTAAIAASLLLGASPLIASDTSTDSKMEMKMSAPIILGALELTNAFTRAMPPAAKAGGGFVTIANTGNEDDRLVSASSPAAPVVELHEMRMDGDVMVMRELENGVFVPAGETVMLAPGGLHIMFMKVPTPFAEGEPVPVTLTFEKAGSVDIMLMVAPIGATGMKH